MFIPRTILPALERELKTPQAVILTGMRRTGKTTLIQRLYSLTASQNKAFFDFENPLHVRFFDTDDFDRILPNLGGFGIDSQHRAYLFIDEIQNLPRVSRVMKYLHDHYQTKFFVTGSSSFYIKDLFPESLAGRKFVFELFPLTFGEFLTFKKVLRKEEKSFKENAHDKNEAEHLRLLSYLEEYLEFGGFPGVVLEPKHLRKKRILEEVVKSYFEKDVKTLVDLEDRSKLRDLIFLLSPRIASHVEIGKLAAELSISRAKIYAYLEFLEQTYFITLLPRFSKSIDRSSAGRKKLFLVDCGLAHFFGKAGEGQRFENCVFQNLRTNHTLAFFSQKGREIDFIVDQTMAIEVKLSASKQDVYALQRMSESLHIPEYYIVSKHWSANKDVIPASFL